MQYKQNTLHDQVGALFEGHTGTPEALIAKLQDHAEEKVWNGKWESAQRAKDLVERLKVLKVEGGQS